MTFAEWTKRLTAHAEGTPLKTLCLALLQDWGHDRRLLQQALHESYRGRTPPCEIELIEHPDGMLEIRERT